MLLSASPSSSSEEEGSWGQSAARHSSVLHVAATIQNFVLTINTMKNLVRSLHTVQTDRRDTENR